MYEWWRVAGGGSYGWRGHQSHPEQAACDGASLAPHSLQEALGAEVATCAKAGKARCTWTRTEVFSVGAGVGPSVVAFIWLLCQLLKGPQFPDTLPSALPDSLTTLAFFSLCWDVSWRTLCQWLRPAFKLCFKIGPLCETCLPSHSLVSLPLKNAGACSPWRMPERVAPSPRNLPDPGIEPGFPVLPADSLPSEPPEKPLYISPCAKIDYKCPI